jgi:hypothetical protein
MKLVQAASTLKAGTAVHAQAVLQQHAHVREDLVRRGGADHDESSSSGALRRLPR